MDVSVNEGNVHYFVPGYGFRVAGFWSGIYFSVFNSQPVTRNT
jgi:hypothetical protein